MGGQDGSKMGWRIYTNRRSWNPRWKFEPNQIRTVRGSDRPSREGVSDGTKSRGRDVGVAGEGRVKRCYGIVGDVLNPVIDALRGNGKIEFIH